MGQSQYCWDRIQNQMECGWEISESTSEISNPRKKKTNSEMLNK